MNKEKLKKYRQRDFKDCIKILKNEWDLGRTMGETDGILCSKIYMYNCLENSDFVYCYHKNKKVVGFIGIKIYKNKRNSFLYRFYSNKKEKLKNSKLVKNKEGLKKYYEIYNIIEEDKISNFDCELSIFITNEEYRNQGIGQKMFEFLVEKAKLLSLKKMRIDTDDSCNIDFYIKRGCNIIQKSFVDSGHQICTEYGYVLEKVLN
ncbi:MAG: GNAT family N-acetyltransferase [Clostridia bacterium]|nr:GNAT family N-acetyltransferase [Clostridia bacterium]